MRVTSGKSLNDCVTELPGIGKKRKADLERLNIRTVGDLLNHFPRDYIDRSIVTRVDMLEPGQAATVRVSIKKKPETVIRGKLTITTASASDDTGGIELRWFNQPYLERALQPGEYICSGTAQMLNGRVYMETPEYERITGGVLLSALRIVPVYPLTQGISQKAMRKLLKLALDMYADAPGTAETLPNEVIMDNNIIPRHEAIANIHYPASAEAFHSARSTLVFTELFTLQMSLLRLRGGITKTKGCLFEKTDSSAFEDTLPFRLTSAQQRVLGELKAGMSSGYVMNRLIQGDVGSGKTAVVMAAMYISCANGYQSALMAPTETLARQHFAGISALFSKLGINADLLTGSLTKKEKDAVKERLAKGETGIVVGTHALITDNVAFNKLGLVICDEQHRFGVRQRGLLGLKGECPHIVIMSATPIPRTLALILYGDLDMSVIDELPPGRAAIKTYAVTPAHRGRVFAFIRKLAGEGRQAFIVCPVIEESESGLKSVKTYAEEAQRTMGINVAVMHGKLRQDEKDAAMQSLVSGEIPVMVSTTVIEVGIDVPNAAVMLIENAERFGLSQLHQLRGRVGRGKHQSYCILIQDTASVVSAERMKAMTQTNDGFVLADLDLKLRGPGDFLGTKQHGLPELTIANLYRDGDILIKAQDAARKYYGRYGGGDDMSLSTQLII